MNRIILKMIRLTFLLFLIQISGFPCTVLYFTGNGYPFAGNNEDWKDNRTIITFVSPEDGGYCWLKFGYKSGFPQGGMNAHGLVWDATGVPFKDMPESMSNKSLYSGPLMRKVMEECRNVDEAMHIFNTYYCEDQFKSQYLIGDADGNSVIVEGDNYIRENSVYQLITNFYHSDPDLGGYPCKRYEKAEEILNNSDKKGIALLVEVLSATSQSGKYPTQYSNIYLPEKRSVRIFSRQNFEEFIEIKMDKTNILHNRELDIPLLFSNVKVISPNDNIVVDIDTLTIEWSGKSSSKYEVILSEDPEFSSDEIDCFPVSPAREDGVNNEPIFFGSIGLFFVPVLRKKKISSGSMLCLAVLFLFFYTGCVNGPDSDGEDISYYKSEITGLEEGIKYYWKIRSNSGTSEFISETFGRSFRTTNGAVSY